MSGLGEMCLFDCKASEGCRDSEAGAPEPMSVPLNSKHQPSHLRAGQRQVQSALVARMMCVPVNPPEGAFNDVLAVLDSEPCLYEPEARIYRLWSSTLRRGRSLVH